MTTWVPVVRVETLPAGDFAQADVDGVIVAIFNVDGEFYAVEDQCTHDGGGLSGGPVENCEVVCPRHGARFSLKTGAALTPPAYEPIRTYATRVIDGMIEVRSSLSTEGA
jgi:3-phenylpropionate/trans-cinnamate dioxygenase ferredoxin subunit